jgi:hypothetical protein
MYAWVCFYVCICIHVLMFYTNVYACMFFALWCHVICPCKVILYLIKHNIPHRIGDYNTTGRYKTFSPCLLFVSWREEVTFCLDDDAGCFVLDQHTESNFIVKQYLCMNEFAFMYVYVYMSLCFMLLDSVLINFICNCIYVCMSLPLCMSMYTWAYAFMLLDSVVSKTWK